MAGRKLTTPGRRVASGGGSLMKSQTLPRSMGRSSSQPNSSSNGSYSRYPVKPSSTPPAVKRQLSVSFILVFYKITLSHSKLPSKISTVYRGCRGTLNKPRFICPGRADRRRRLNVHVLTTRPRRHLGS